MADCVNVVERDKEDIDRLVYLIYRRLSITQSICLSFHDMHCCVNPMKSFVLNPLTTTSNRETLVQDIFVTTALKLLEYSYYCIISMIIRYKIL